MLAEISMSDLQKQVRPSALSRLVKCPGSAYRQAVLAKRHPLELPQEPTAAEIGTAAHVLVALCNGDATRLPDIQKEPHYINVTRNDATTIPVRVTEDMAQITGEYCRYITALAPAEPGGGRIEALVNCDHLLSLEGEPCSGTIDYVWHDQKNETLHIVDLKTGRNPVPVRDNEQLMCYAAATARDHVDIAKVCLHIVQPSVGPPTTQRWRAEDLLFAAELLTDGVKTEVKKGAKARIDPSESGCKYCAAAGYCPELKQASMDVFWDLAKDTSVDLLTNNELSALQEPLELLKTFCKAVEARLLSELLSGEDVPGYKLIRANSHRRFKDEEKATRFVWDNFWDIESHAKKLRTPAQLEREIRIALSDDNYSAEERKALDAEFRALWSKPKGSPKAVPVEHKGEPMALDAKTDFFKGEKSV